MDSAAHTYLPERERTDLSINLLHAEEGGGGTRILVPWAPTLVSGRRSDRKFSTFTPAVVPSNPPSPAGMRVLRSEIRWVVRGPSFDGWDVSQLRPKVDGGVLRLRH